MFSIKNQSRNEKILTIIMRQVENLLLEMHKSGRDLSKIKLKKFQKTHHIDCQCQLCHFANTKNDPSIRGLIEDGFKIYLDDCK